MRGPAPDLASGPLVGRSSPFRQSRNGSPRPTSRCRLTDVVASVVKRLLALGSAAAGGVCGDPRRPTATLDPEGRRSVSAERLILRAVGWGESPVATRWSRTPASRWSRRPTRRTWSSSPSSAWRRIDSVKKDPAQRNPGRICSSGRVSIWSAASGVSPPAQFTFKLRLAAAGTPDHHRRPDHHSRSSASGPAKALPGITCAPIRQLAPAIITVDGRYLALALRG